MPGWLAGGSLGPAASLSDFSSGGHRGLLHLSFESRVALPFSWACVCHGMAGHGITRDVCDDWGRAAEGTPGDGLHRAIDAEENSNGGLAAHWWSDDRGARSAKRHSNGTPRHTRTCGVCGGAAFLAPAATLGPRHGEDERSVELLSPHAETAAGFRHRDSHVRRDGGYFCGSLRDKRQRRHHSKVRRACLHSADDFLSHLCAVGKDCGASWPETVRDCDVLLFWSVPAH